MKNLLLLMTSILVYAGTTYAGHLDNCRRNDYNSCGHACVKEGHGVGCYGAYFGAWERQDSFVMEAAFNLAKHHLSKECVANNEESCEAYLYLINNCNMQTVSCLELREEYARMRTASHQDRPSPRRNIDYSIPLSFMNDWNKPADTRKKATHCVTRRIGPTYHTVCD